MPVAFTVISGRNQKRRSVIIFAAMVLSADAGLMLRDAGEHCLVSLRIVNKRQRVEDIPLRWNRLQTSSPRGVSLENVLCGKSLNFI